MDGVGVVPHHGKVGRPGLHRRKTPAGIVRIGDPGGVRVLRHAPDPLDGGIESKFFDLIHIGSRRRHVDRDQLEAHLFGDGEVAVVTRRGAEPFALLYARPRRGRVGKPEEHGARDRPVHQGKTGVAPDDDLLRRDPEQLGKETAHRGKPPRAAVVPAIETVDDALGGRERTVQKLHRKIELIRRGFAPREVEFQPLAEIGVVLLREPLLFTCQFVAVHFAVNHSKNPCFAFFIPQSCRMTVEIYCIILHSATFCNPFCKYS